MDMEDSEGVHWYRMESIIWFLIYITRKYRYMNPYLKVLHLTLDSWIPYREKYGYQLQGRRVEDGKTLWKMVGYGRSK